jgi:para-aminobenzoate synthetase component 1
LRDFLNASSSAPIIPGFLSYDLKNHLENLKSQNPDLTDFPLLSFLKPECIIGELRNGQSFNYGYSVELEENSIDWEKPIPPIEMQVSMSEESYTQRFDQLKNHILRGDIYEINFCMHFGAYVPSLEPIQLFKRLCLLSPAPFSCVMKNGSNWLIGSSPERFLKKEGTKLISQPIKGTVRRSADEDIDQLAISKLKSDPKERAENVMIVDLVRNDLSHFAKRGSVQVAELCEVYPFATVHHMISTVEAELTSADLGLEAIKKAFPMGSMTGAPKIRAMELAEETENFRRGIYSGALGYFTSEGDYDFAVMIRSFTWNATSGYLSFSTGSAITNQANASAEYHECLLKAEAMLKSLQK